MKFKPETCRLLSNVLTGHLKEMSEFKDVISKGRRKCFCCKRIINVGERLKEGYMFDRCPHRSIKHGRTYFMHCKVQICLECVKNPDVKDMFPRANFNRYTALVNYSDH